MSGCLGMLCLGVGVGALSSAFEEGGVLVVGREIYALSETYIFRTST